MSKATILVVEDEPNMRRVLQLMLEGFGNRVVAVDSAEAALPALASAPIDLAFTDLNLPGESGLDLLRRMRSEWPDVTVVMVTAHATVETAVQAMKLGAHDYLTKPFRIDELEALVAHVEALRRTERENLYLREVDAAAYEGLIGETPAMRAVFDRIERIAASPATVLISGETGTGKELVARAIHARSGARGLFVAVNCAAIPSELLEAELFGVVRGAYTGATRDRPGKFELADGGTIFLDEIGDMPREMQAKLLRVLQERTVERLGAGATRSVDVRVIAATHRNLTEMAASGDFREDLLYRLAVVPVELPPLRRRRADVGPLAQAAVQRFASQQGRRIRLTSEAVERLARYDWPGNVRELHNVVERAVLLAHGDVLDADDFADLPVAATLHPAGTFTPHATTLADVVADAERAAIRAALEVTGDNKTRAAERLGISVRALWYKLQRLGIATGAAPGSVRTP